jgi:hypothetical protein
MTDPKKPGLVFWASVIVVVALIAYPLSFGPACWWFSSRLSETRAFGASEGPDPLCAPRMYWPIGWAAQNAPRQVGDAIFWYATFGLHGYSDVMLPTDRCAERTIRSTTRFESFTIE